MPCVLHARDLQDHAMERSRMKSNESDPDRPIWGAREIAKVINRPERAVFHLLEKGHLPAGKVGGTWVTSRRKLLQHIGIEAA